MMGAQLRRTCLVVVGSACQHQRLRLRLTNNEQEKAKDKGSVSFAIYYFPSLPLRFPMLPQPLLEWRVMCRFFYASTIIYTQKHGDVLYSFAISEVRYDVYAAFTR
uniref:Uncharacterized protein n=1 Tax=Trypanosoma congolense (strain IL3000) TaxID=1068625 RepID=G0US49_TRYCI|nr:hypothetical protein, unlikely [Trypanosoma congolense IL3000]